MEKKSKDYYVLLVMEKAWPPNIICKWRSDFNLSDDHLREFFLLPHSAVLESYVVRPSSIKCFILYSIQIKNYSKSDVCTFCETNHKLCTISFTNALTQAILEQF